MSEMNWLAVYPEVLLLVTGLLVALVDLWVRDERRTPTYVLTQLSLAAVAALHLAYFQGGFTVYGMNRMVVSDPLGHLLAGCATLAVMIALAYSRAYAASRDMLKGELFSLSMLMLLGACVMLSANNFLVVYLGLELMSLSLYAMTALRRDHPPATEAAMKYFVLGALASGFLLYGLSMLYGATGTLDIPGSSMRSRLGRSTRRCWSSAWCLSSRVWRSSSAWCPSTCGCPTFTTVRPRPSPC